MARSRPRYTWRFWESAQSILPNGTSLSFDLATLGSWPDLSALGVVGDFTVRRFHMLIGGMSLNTTDISGLDSITYGVYVAGNDSVVGGTLADPASDPADWMVFGSLYVPLSSAGGLATTHPLVQHRVDNRSMRRVNENH